MRDRRALGSSLGALVVSARLGYGVDDSLALGVCAVGPRFEVAARRAVTRRGWSQQLLLGVDGLEAGRRLKRARGESSARSALLSAHSMCALGGGYGGDDSFVLGVGAVDSSIEVTARHVETRWTSGCTSTFHSWALGLDESTSAGLGFELLLWATGSKPAAPLLVALSFWGHFAIFYIVLQWTARASAL
jgi:hypothetical protein